MTGGRTHGSRDSHVTCGEKGGSPMRAERNTRALRSPPSDRPISQPRCRSPGWRVTEWDPTGPKSQKTLGLCRPRRRPPCPRSAIRAFFSTGDTSRSLGGVPKVQRSRNWMGALDACAHRAASDPQTSARMANGAGDNVRAMIIPLLHDDSMRAQCARNILLPTHSRARRLAD